MDGIWGLTPLSTAKVILWQTVLVVDEGSKMPEETTGLQRGTVRHLPWMDRWRMDGGTLRQMEGWYEGWTIEGWMDRQMEGTVRGMDGWMMEDGMEKWIDGWMDEGWMDGLTSF